MQRSNPARPRERRLPPSGHHHHRRRFVNCTSFVGCIVDWNNEDQLWDCGCHGSRYSPAGAVLHGPAVEPLAPVEVGPFYCPPDERIYLGLGFLAQLQKQFGAEVRYAPAQRHRVGDDQISLL